jgi:uncharacterized protein YukE
MAGFSIDTASAMAVANGLQQEEEQIVTYIKGTMAIAEDMAVNFKGNTAASYQQAKQLWDEGIKKMDVGMRNACDVLRNNVNSYHTNDDDLKSLFSNFHVG